MRTLGRIVGGLVFIGVPWLVGVGCAVPVEPAPEPEESSGTVSGGDEGNLGEVSEGLSFACHGSVSCPSPKSCGSWSGFYACGQQCNPNRGCGGCGPVLQDPTCVVDGTKGVYEYDEQFRSCILQNGSACTEYTAAAGPHLVSCGC